MCCVVVNTTVVAVAVAAAGDARAKDEEEAQEAQHLLLAQPLPVHLGADQHREKILSGLAAASPF